MQVPAPKDRPEDEPETEPETEPENQRQTEEEPDMSTAPSKRMRPTAENGVDQFSSGGTINPAFP